MIPNWTPQTPYYPYDPGGRGWVEEKGEAGRKNRSTYRPMRKHVSEIKP
jgi:hypothetical protein